MAVMASAATTFALDFKNLVNKSTFADLKFLIQGKEIDAHKVIVFSRCPALLKEILNVKNKQETPDPTTTTTTDATTNSASSDSSYPSVQTTTTPSDVTIPAPPPPPASTTTDSSAEVEGENETVQTPQEVLPRVESCTGASVSLENIEFFVFVAFLRYLYTDQVKAPLHHVPKLIVLANLYELPRMAIICKRLLMFKEAPVWGGDQSGLHQEPIPPSTFSSDLSTAINTSENADITFTLADNSLVFGHKSILISRSDYFRTIFEGSFRESGETHVDMKEIERATFLELLRFMYTNDITDVDDQIVDVLIASGRFLLDDLKQKIEKHLESQLDVENTLDLLFLSESAHTPKLRKACVSMLVDNLTKVKSKNANGLKDLRLNSPLTMKHVEYLYRKKYDPNFNANDLLKNGLDVH